MKSFQNFLVKSTSECYFCLGNKVSTDSNENFLKFSVKVFRISFRPLLIQTLKCWNVLEIFWSKVHQNAISDLQTKFQLILTSTLKSTSECYFWLANKVSTDSNEYFLKFSVKVFRISFRPKKSLLGHFWFKL